MGYFDGLTSGNFKTAKDGRKLFFPWGYLGRGYVLASERDGERMRRQLKIYYIVMLAAIVGTSGVHAYIISAAVAVLAIIFYLIWSRYQVAGLTPSSEGLSFREASSSQARAFGPRILWLLEICALVFVAGGVFLYANDPASRPIALLTIVFFGCCAALISYQLVIRRRTKAP